MGKAEAPPRPPERRMQVCTCSGEDVGDPGGNRGWGYRDLLAKPIPRLSDSLGTERETETEKVLANFLSFIREPGPQAGRPRKHPGPERGGHAGGNAAGNLQRAPRLSSRAKRFRAGKR